MYLSRTSIAAAALCLTVGAGSSASAATIPIGVAAFGAGSTLTILTGASGTEVNGLVADGLTFQYSLGNGFVTIGSGPGVTNNLANPAAVSIGNNTGSVTVLLPSLSSAFGYGFALLSTNVNPAATTVTLFNGVTNVGSLSYAGAPDPTFTGGFAGIQSTLAFDRAVITFDSVNTPAFAFNNIRTMPADVPEPATLLLVGAAMSAGLTRRRRRR